MAKVVTRPVSYFGIKLSDNVVETPEEYLVFKNAVIARTGFQMYKGKELPEDELEDQGIVVNPDDDVNVYRSPEEVFSKLTIASFEGKPVTDGHIAMLDVDTHAEHSEGHIQNVRPGTEPLENGDMPLLADVYVTSRNLISKYKAGIRELSCGYNYHIVKQGNQLLQVDITGNHVAFVENGRAGQHVRVNDSKPNEEMSMEQTAQNAIGDGLKAVAEKSTGAQFLAFLSSLNIFGAKPAVAFDAEPEPAAKDAKAADAERMHKALDKMLAGRDNAQQEQEANDAADLEALKSMFAAKGNDSEASEEAGREAAAEEETAATDEDGEEEENQEYTEDEAVESNPSPAIPAGERSAKMVPSATDAAYRAGAKAALDGLKPFIARSKNKQLMGAYDTAAKLAKGSGWQGAASYTKFAHAASTASDSAQRSMVDAEQEREQKMEKAYAEARNKMRGVK